MLIFVYGTLRSGFHNNWMLRRATKVSTAKTVQKMSMAMIGTIPAVTDHPTTHIVGEVWEVDAETLAPIDGLELDCGYVTRTVDVILDRNCEQVSCQIYMMAVHNPRCRISKCGDYTLEVKDQQRLASKIKLDQWTSW